MSFHFAEILVVLIVALLVIKPERLPEIALALGRWVKWLRGWTSKIKHELAKYE